MNTKVLAIDLGGSSGRAILGELKEEKLVLKEIHRFSDYVIKKDQHLYWDIEKIFQEIVFSIECAFQQGHVLKSIGIDSWGVDFGLVKRDGSVTIPHCYRDSYTASAYTNAPVILPFDDLYERTGIQPLEINTLFQLIAQKEMAMMEDVKHCLLIPDLLNYLLTGIAKTEISIASTTQLLNPYTNQWDKQLISKFCLPKEIFTELVPAGNCLGRIQLDAFSEKWLHNIEVINVASHDTASAVYSIPNLDNKLFISSGTWSLLGKKIASPLINKQTRAINISNEKGADGQVILLKNLTGLWLIEEAINDYKRRNKNYSYSDITVLIKEIEKKEGSTCYFDTDSSAFMTPGNLIEKIQAFAQKTAQPIPSLPGEIFKSIYESLALKYKETITLLKTIPEIHGNEKGIVIVGGGSQSELLCQYTANALGINVEAGMSEATVIGNLMVQLETITGLSKKNLMEIVKKSFSFKNYVPQDTIEWKLKYEKYIKVKE